MEIQNFRHFNRETNETQYDMPTELMARPKIGNTTGKEVTIEVNSFSVLQFPTKTVYQYDVSSSHYTFAVCPEYKVLQTHLIFEL